IGISKGIKEFNDIKNKLEAGAKVVYQSPNANSNLQTLLKELQSQATNSQAVKKPIKDEPQPIIKDEPKTQGQTNYENIKQMLENGILKENKEGKYLFTDKEGKRQILDKELTHKWLETFNIKDLNEAFKPQFSENIKDILAKEGVDEIHLKIGSLSKIEARNRSEFIDKIKPTLENPHFIFKDKEGINFAQDLGNEKLLFTSIAKNSDGQWIIATNSFKRIKQLENKLKEDNLQGLYKSKEAPNILVGAFTDKPFHVKLDKTILPNSQPQNQVKNKTTQNNTKIKQAKESVTEDAYDIGKKRASNFKPNKNEPLQTQLKRLQEQNLNIDKEIRAIKDELLARKSAPNEAREEELKARLNEFESADYWENYHKQRIIKNIVTEIENVRNFSPKDVYGDASISADTQTIKIQIKKTKQNSKKNGTKIEVSDSKMFEIGKENLKKRRENIEKALNITPIKEFGQNFAEFYKDGQGAVKKLLAESEQAAKDGVEFNGQVAGAFYRDDLGDIDLVWGDSLKGLKHILEKHGDKFAKFDGTTQGEKIASGISEIIAKGEVLDVNGVKTILLKNGVERYQIGLSKGFKGDGVNLWIITSYKVG
ncbi:hypothetical protein DMC01_12740, partial [Campylobacter troglodytis]